MDNTKTLLSSQILATVVDDVGLAHKTLKDLGGHDDLVEKLRESTLIIVQLAISFNKIEEEAQGKPAVTNHTVIM